MTATLLLACTAVLVCTVSAAQGTDLKHDQGLGWPAYGGSEGGQHYSAATQVNRGNVSRLREVWRYHTKALDSHRPGYRSAAFENTPVLFRSTLFITTPFSDIKAIDPASGIEKWSYAATREDEFSEGDLDTSRGVAIWASSTQAKGRCSARVFVGTLTGRLHAVDAEDGKPCLDFGDKGSVDLRQKGDSMLFGLTSAPTIVGDVVIVGSSMPDNYKAEMPRGTVRGYDVRTGQLRWSWDPIQLTNKTGAANAWSTISADSSLGMVFVPTGSASPDYLGVFRPGDNRDADSVVALDAKTGRKIWAFQVVHHNLWDYDVASEPVLFMLRGSIPAVAVTTKMGMVFVLDRRTGQPLYPVEERAVPRSDVPGETASSTQPFSSLPSLSPLSLPTHDSGGWKRTQANVDRCNELIQPLRSEGIYTPPSLQGTLIFPGGVGGVNWGGPALSPEPNVIYANTNRLAYSVKLVPRYHPGPFKIFIQRHIWRLPQVLVVFAVAALIAAFVRKWRWMWTLLALTAGCVVGVVLLRPTVTYIDPVIHMMEGAFGHDTSPMLGTPYELRRDPLKDKDGAPCFNPPWGALTAINLDTGTKLWERPLGTMYAESETGTINLGGPIVTAGGILFDAAARDNFFRAFDTTDGSLLWKTEMPVPAQATPMTYMYKGRQYVVIADGGHGLFGTATSDAVIAYALDDSAK